MSFFRQPPKDQDETDKSKNDKRIDEIFQAIEDNFKYKERKRSGLAKVTPEREEELKNVPKFSTIQKTHKQKKILF